jgi:hypothetical protein
MAYAPQEVQALYNQDTGDFVSLVDMEGVAIPTGLTDEAGSLGYASTTRETVTQLTSKATGVTLAAVQGTIVLHDQSLADEVDTAFVFTNAEIGADDFVGVCVKDGLTGNYLVSVTEVNAGSCTIALRNVSGSAQATAVVLKFMVFKG